MMIDTGSVRKAEARCYPRPGKRHLTNSPAKMEIGKDERGSRRTIMSTRAIYPARAGEAPCSGCAGIASSGKRSAHLLPASRSNLMMFKEAWMQHGFT